jgi:hypothetical protein
MHEIFPRSSSACNSPFNSMNLHNNRIHDMWVHYTNRDTQSWQCEPNGATWPDHHHRHRPTPRCNLLNGVPHDGPPSRDWSTSFLEEQCAHGSKCCHRQWSFYSQYLHVQYVVGIRSGMQARWHEKTNLSICSSRNNLPVDLPVIWYP